MQGHNIDDSAFDIIVDVMVYKIILCTIDMNSFVRCHSTSLTWCAKIIFYFFESGVHVPASRWS